MHIGDYVEIIQDEHPDPKTGEVLDIDDNSGYIFVMENNPSFDQYDQFHSGACNWYDPGDIYLIESAVGA